MTLIKANAILPVIPRFFDDFMAKERANLDNQSLAHSLGPAPAINLIESHEGYLLELAAPGFQKEDFHIELNDETLTIQSTREQAKELADGNRYLRKEIGDHNFKRSFHLPNTVVDGENILAKYEAGILQLMIPKKEEAKAKPPRQITVE